MRLGRAYAVASCLVLASCGGGGGGSASGGTPVAAVPTPTPTATPTPTPAPAVQNARFTAEAAGGVAGTIVLVVGDDPDAAAALAQAYTDASGSWLAGTTTSSYGQQAQTADFPGFNFSANYALRAFGLERPTRLARSFVAPRGSTTASPLTSLISVVGSQQLVRTAFGLGPNANFTLPADLDLTTYSATQDQAAGTPRYKPGQVLAANLRVLALQQAVEAFGAEPGAPSSYGMGSDPLAANRRIAAYIRANPAATLATAEGIRDVLRSLRAGSTAAYRDDVYQAAGYLVQTFDLATRLIDDNPALAPRFSLAVIGSLRARLDDLAEQNSAAAAARVPATNSVAGFADEADRFADQLAFATGNFFPVPDFFRLSPGGQLLVYKDNSAGYGQDSRIAARPNMTGNDALWNQNLVYGRAATIRGISVPAAFAGAISAVLQADGSVQVSAKPGFTGIAWYDYQTVLDTGQAETGRVYLTVL